MSIFDDIVGVQPMSESTGKIFKLRIIDNSDHVCAGECDDLQLVHDFVRGYGYRYNCPKSVDFIPRETVAYLVDEQGRYPMLINKKDLWAMNKLQLSECGKFLYPKEVELNGRTVYEACFEYGNPTCHVIVLPDVLSDFLICSRMSVEEAVEEIVEMLVQEDGEHMVETLKSSILYDERFLAGFDNCAVIDAGKTMWKEMTNK